MGSLGGKATKQQNKHSAKTYKITSTIAYILCVLCMIVGIPTFMVGGFFFVIVGIFIFLLGRGWKKEYLNILSKETNNTIDIQTHEQINPSVKAQATQSDIGSKVETHKVAGVSFLEQEIFSIGFENEDYTLSRKELVDLGYCNERIYQYDFYTNKVELEPEPDNPYDSKAIKVIVNNTHVGYIKSGSCSHIHNLLNEDKILKIDCEIKGGKYKYLDYNDIDDSYSLIKDSSPVSICLKIHIK